MHPPPKESVRKWCMFQFIAYICATKAMNRTLFTTLFLDVETLLMVSFQYIDPPNQNSTLSYLRTTQFHFYAEVHYR